MNSRMVVFRHVRHVLTCAVAALAACTAETTTPRPPRTVQPATVAQAATYDCAVDQAQLSIADCQALVALYTSTNGAGWTNAAGWMQTATPCSWYGVYCSGGSVWLIRLEGNNLTGTIPSELGSLSGAFSLLDLGRNALTGVIPTSLRGLANLRDLSLDNNQLTGGIPVELSSLTKLASLDLSSNQLTGGIPPELSLLSNLSTLSLSRNQLSGSIPPSLVALTNLISLFLDNNQLTGAIPVWLSTLTKLIVLTLDRNQLSGTVPSALGSLTKLNTLTLNHNKLSGQIPPELGRLSSLSTLWLGNNQLTGTIPPELGALTNLASLDLRSNAFTGNLPASLTNLTSLRGFAVQANNLNGLIPLSVAQFLGVMESQPFYCDISGNAQLQLGNSPSYRAADLDMDGLICNLSFPTSHVLSIVDVTPASYTTLPSENRLTATATLNPPDPTAVIGWSITAGPAMQFTPVLPSTPVDGPTTQVSVPRQNIAHWVSYRHPGTLAQKSLSFAVVATASGIFGGPVQSSPRTATQDENDTMRQEYIDLGMQSFGGVPTHDSFGTPVSPNFSAAELNRQSNGTSDYRLYLAESRFLSGIEGARQTMSASFKNAFNGLIVTSGYRNPVHHRVHVGSKDLGSHHQYGRAMDFSLNAQPGTSAKDYFSLLDFAIKQAGGCFEPEDVIRAANLAAGRGYVLDHAHGDWRSPCPESWN